MQVSTLPLLSRRGVSPQQSFLAVSERHSDKQVYNLWREMSILFLFLPCSSYVVSIKNAASCLLNTSALRELGTCHLDNYVIPIIQVISSRLGLSCKRFAPPNIQAIIWEICFTCHVRLSYGYHICFSYHSSYHIVVSLVASLL